MARRVAGAILSGEWSRGATELAEKSKSRRTATFAEYAEEWISTRTNRHGEHLRPRTAAEYHRLVAGPLTSFAALRLGTITPEGVRNWYSDLVKSGTKTQAARAYELLKSILATAVTDGRIKSNPCQVRGAASASTGRKVTPPTAAELQTIVDTITPRFKATVVPAAWTGVRCGELTELRLEDIDVLEGDTGEWPSS